MVRTSARHRARRTASTVALAVSVLTAGVALAATLGGVRPPDPVSSASDASPARPSSPSASSRVARSSAPAPLSVVGLGDSVTAGSNCACASFVERYGTMLAARDGRPVTTTNLGVPGLTTASLAQQLSEPAPSAAVAAADTVLVTIGANDLSALEDQWDSGGCDAACQGPAVAAMASRLAPDLARIKALGHPGQRVEVTTYWNVFEDGDVADQQRGSGFADWSHGVTMAANQAICAAAQSFGDICVDLYVPFLSADGTRNPTPLLADDGDHPNAAGHDVIARALLDATPR
nr:SGNH/GDSL hydrolase family protein [Pedococcus badiiscoriae]